MKTTDYQSFINDVKNGVISPYQMYNTDIDYPQYYAVDYYLNHPNDTIDKNMPIQTCFLDIEVYTGNSGKFPKPQEAEFPINSLTLRSSFEKKYVSFYMLTSRNASKFPYDDIKIAIDYYKKELIENKYIKDDEDIEIHLFNNELAMLKSFWVYIHNMDPAVLSGWYSSDFDIPYMYHRACKLTDDERGFEAARIMSKFGVVKKTKLRNKVLVNISDYTDMDLAYLYRPRDEGGLVN